MYTVYYIIAIVVITLLLLIIYDVFWVVKEEGLNMLTKTSCNYEDYGRLGGHYKKLDSLMAQTNDYEGHSAASRSKINFIQSLLKTHNIKSVAEIGFNAGHSAALFLEHNNQGGINRLVSFDLCEHDYSRTCASYIKRTFQNRWTLICGDSTKTIPKYTGERFDLILVDGGHFGDIPKKDLDNTLNYLAKNGSIILMDDTFYCYTLSLLSKLTNFTVEQTWDEFLEKNKGKVKLLDNVRGLAAAVVITQ